MTAPNENEGKDTIAVSESKENFETWISREYISAELKEQLRGANVLIVPLEGYRDSKIPVFPLGTTEILDFLREEAPPNFNVDVCIENDNYKMLALHSDVVDIGKFIVTYLAAPILANLIAEYLKRKVYSEKRKAEVRVSMTIVDRDKGSRCVKYVGSLKGFERIIDKLREQ